MAMASGTLTSRLLGLVRMAVMVGVFGSGLTAAANAFDVANGVPNFIYAILAGGVLNAVLVPQIVRAFADGRGNEYVYRLLTLGTVILAVLTIALTLGAAWLVLAFTSGWPADQLALATTFAYWCVPQVFFYGLYTLWGQVLNARGSFAAVMWAPVLNNVISIIGFGTFAIVFKQKTDVTGWSGGQVFLVAGTATAGIALQALVLLIPMARLGLWPRLRFGFRGYGLSRAATIAGWTTLATLVDQTAMLVAVRFSSAAQHAAPNGQLVASNWALTYGLSTYIIPHSLITVSLTTAIFTRMSQAAVAGDMAAVRRDLSYGIRTTSVFSCFFTAVLVTLALPITRLLLFTSSPDGIAPAAAVLVPLALGLVPLGITLLVRRVFFALDDGRTVFWLQVPMSLVWIGFAFLSIKLLPPSWWVIGVGLGQTLSFLAGAVLRLNSLHDRLGGVDGRRLAWMHLRTGAAAVVTGLFGYLLGRWLPFASPIASRGAALGNVVVVGLAMTVVYLLCLRLMRVRELSDFLAPALSKLRHRSAG